MLAVALVLPLVVVFLRYRMSWWSAGIATIYYVAASGAVGVQVAGGELTEADGGLLLAALAPGWLAIVAAVGVTAVRRRRRLRRIQSVLDANPVPDTVPEWMSNDVAVRPLRRARPARAGNVFRLRYPATCSSCGAHLPARSRARWDATAKQATCVVCVEGAATAPAPGTAGGSARTIADKGTQRGMVSAPRWAKGADGEERVGHWLNEVHEQGCYVLHDRRIPGSKANIDHLVVSRAGVWVIDAKNYSGRPSFEGEDGAGGATRFRIDGYDRHDLIGGVARQVDAVRQAVGGSLIGEGVDVRGLLCFVGTTSELLVRPLAVGDVGIAWPGVVLALLERTPGPLCDDDMRGLARRLENGLPPAAAVRRPATAGR